MLTIPYILKNLVSSRVAGRSSHDDDFKLLAQVVV
jgi:hypothetical protein